MSHIKSVSGIPWDLLCPECKVTDFYSEIVPRKDWNLGRFKKNPVILKSHPKPREYKLAAFCPDPKCKGNCNYQSHHLRPQQRKIK